MCTIYIYYIHIHTYFQLPVPHSSEFGTGRRQVATGHEHPVVQPLGPEKGAPGREVGLVHVCHGDALDLSLSLPVRDLITTHYNSYLYITLYNIIELLMMYSFCEKKQTSLQPGCQSLHGRNAASKSSAWDDSWDVTGWAAGCRFLTHPHLK